MNFVLTLVSIACATSAFADESRTSAIVREWQAKNDNIRDLRFDYEDTYEDVAFGDKSVARGHAVYFRSHSVGIGRDGKAIRFPSHSFRIDWKDRGNPSAEQGSILVVGRDKWLYDPSSRSVHKYGEPEQAQNRSWLIRFLDGLSEGVFQFWTESLFPGLLGESIGKEFKVSLLDENEANARLQLEPRNPKKGSIVEKVHVVLDKKTSLVTEATFMLSNRDRMVRVYKNHKVNADPPVVKEDLLKDLPKGFREVP